MSTIEATPLKLRIVNYLQQQIHQIHQQGPLYSSAYNDIRVVDVHFHTNSWYLYIYTQRKGLFFSSVLAGVFVCEWLFKWFQMLFSSPGFRHLPTASERVTSAQDGADWESWIRENDRPVKGCRTWPYLTKKKRKMAKLRIEHIVFMVFQVYMQYIIYIYRDYANKWWYPLDFHGWPMILHQFKKLSIRNLGPPTTGKTVPFSFQKTRHRLYVHESTVRCHAQLSFYRRGRGSDWTSWTLGVLAIGKGEWQNEQWLRSTHCWLMMN